MSSGETRPDVRHQSVNCVWTANILRMKREREVKIVSE